MNFLNKEKIKRILDTKKALLEMRYAPDQTQYGLTRRQMERMLAAYERRADENGWNDDPEYRSVDGWKRAKWFPPEVNSDYLPDAIYKNTTQERPAKLMPYDYYYNVFRNEADKEDHYDIDADDDTKNPNKDLSWKGETNVY